MDYLLKVKNASLKVASQGISLIQNVGQDMGLAPPSANDKKAPPVDDFTMRFRSEYTYTLPSCLTTIGIRIIM